MTAPLVHAEVVMGTVVSFAVHGRDADPGDGSGDGDPGHDGQLDVAHRAVAEACRLLHRADDVFSTWRPWSPLSRLRRGAARLDELAGRDAGEIAAVLALCLEARAASGGWFDPWAVPGGVDPTGLVKGWALERAAAVLDAAGLRAVVGGGGDVVTCGAADGPRGWRVGVRHPWRPMALACVVRGGGPARAVATSGAYERGAHLVDPRTGRRTVGAVASATVAGPDLALADALATAVAVGGRPAFEAVAQMAASLGRYEAYVVGHDGDEWWTEGFPFADAATGADAQDPSADGCPVSAGGAGEALS